ncbi:MAG TPA: hypothetical protein VN608_06820, partial [Clostridia bacterium]|nr:hypothetical protein [Clostridia bacterium]
LKGRGTVFAKLEVILVVCAAYLTSHSINLLGAIIYLIISKMLAPANRNSLTDLETFYEIRARTTFFAPGML